MYSATDLANFVACPHIATLRKAADAGKLKRPVYNDPGTELLRELGYQHEQAFLRHLRDVEKRDVVAISRDSRIKTVTQTLNAMRQGAEVIYQAHLIDDPWHGYADFLLRVDEPSSLGFFSYEAVDTKLARSARVTALIQLCFYSDLLSKIQGIDPQHMHLVLGAEAGRESFQYRKYAAYFRHVLRNYKTAIDQSAATYPEPVEHCRVCDWATHCESQRRRDDHLSLVAGITGRQRKSLVESGITTLTGLAEIDPTQSIEDIHESALTRIREQAHIQLKGRRRKKVVYELIESFEENKGLAALPPPSPGDIFLDFEADPFACTTGLEYLIGIATREENGVEVYDGDWAFNRAEEKEAFERLIARIKEGLVRDPGMHVYHYAPYEVAAIKRLAGRHGTCVDEVDDFLRKGVFVDLYRVVRQSLRASVESYSIKRLEPLFGYLREVPLEEANASLSAFATVLMTRDGRSVSDSMRQTIESYNRDDCISASRLRDWLEERRLEWQDKFGSELPRLTIKEKEGSDDSKTSEYVARVRALEARLLAGIPQASENRTRAQEATRLLAESLEWHRREDKAVWWEYFRLVDLTPDERLQDSSALEGLVYEGPVGVVAQSTIHRYRFPSQDFKVSLGNKSRDPDTGKSAGEVVAIDEENLTIDIKRGNRSDVSHPTALVPFDLYGTTSQRESLLRIGEWVASNGIESPGLYQAARDILLRNHPSGEGDTPLTISANHESLSEAAVRLAAELCDSTLPVQGPPGSGKTFNGARMALELIRDQKRVGITGPSHKVISNLLSSITKAAHERGVQLAIVQKVEEDDEDRCHDEMVEATDTNQAVLRKLQSGEAQIAAGTAWLWSREEFANCVDVLFVDEAGQMSLATVLAISQAASSVVLLGDPQQLEQPRRSAVHPEGTGVSALSHLLDGSATIAADKGLFLRDTWRLHPDVCTFISEQFYDDKLVPQEKNRHQRLNTSGLLDGTGLRLIPVEHRGNRNESREEVEKVREIVERLLTEGTTWTDREGVENELKLEDILIVAPYNAQVQALKRALPDAFVGTVDKFQGQEAPIVIYSMAASSAEDAPRGMEFLYSLNRLNVAISRARCVAVVVASPLLFNAQCKTPRQAELANAFCRFLELAKTG